MLESDTPASKPTSINRAFGRFQLRQLLGTSERTMAWLAFDPGTAQEMMITMPRVQPATPAALELWTRDAQHAARLIHPNLAPIAEIGAQDRWPFVAVARDKSVTLAEHLAANPKIAPIESVSWLIQVLNGLAFAHEAGVCHFDLQLHHILLFENGNVRVMALAAAGAANALPDNPKSDQNATTELGQIHAVRQSAKRDVLCVAILLYRLLVERPAFDEADSGRVIKRLPPWGSDTLRLPRITPAPVSEGLRAIVNRATERLGQHRYHSARTLLNALQGWRDIAAQENAGPVAILLDRLNSIGHLPSGPGVAERVNLLVRSEDQRTDEMAEQILQDIGLSFELLRSVNSAHAKGSQIAGNGPILTVRRAIAMLGVKGVRQAASSLRAWPGPLANDHAVAMQRQIERVRLAGHTAQVLRPAGYDAELIYLITVMQSLGQLMVSYHFPTQAEEIYQLVNPLATTKSQSPEQAGMSEAQATLAVLGVDAETLGAAVAKQWGLSDEVLQMIRRLPTDLPVRQAEGENEMLRLAASAANEAVDASILLPPHRMSSAFDAVSHRYARVMPISPRDIKEALQVARTAIDDGKFVAPQRQTPLIQNEPELSEQSEFAKTLAARKR